MKLKESTLISSRYALEEARIKPYLLRSAGPLTRVCLSIEFFDAPSSDLPQGVSLPDKDAPIVFAAIEGKATHLKMREFIDDGPDGVPSYTQGSSE